ncbi:hypothetical protein Hanom_Chr09g00780341 [Helianthus anomalus]
MPPPSISPLPSHFFRPTTAEHYHATTAPCNRMATTTTPENTMCISSSFPANKNRSKKQISFLYSSDFVNGSKGEIQICNNFTYFL